MAAKDSAGFQEFPLASFAVPSVEQMEERVALVVNSQDGLQSLGQSVEDPYPRAVKYIERHRIVEVFQNLTSRLAYEKPADPLQFMLDEIEKIRKGQKLDDLK